MLDLSECKLAIHVYQLQEDGPGQEELDDEDLAAANHWLLPSSDFAGLWNSLVFDSDVKSQVKTEERPIPNFAKELYLQIWNFI